MKLFKMMLVAGVSVAVLSGCGANNNNATNLAATTAPATEQTDAVTTASIVNQADAFTKAVSKDGNWIIAILNDVTIAQDVVVEGEFHDKGAQTATSTVRLLFMPKTLITKLLPITHSLYLS